MHAWIAGSEEAYVRIAVQACGVCGTDHAFVNGAFPGLTWPLTPGHEIAGVVAIVALEASLLMQG